ncbi:uncharacterized protein [Diadema antillarum]|uniref:uncharacterized protein n=1 Tax=Diadema antillarum TaxID=105358 RepID=UPI003A89D193
MASLLPLPIKTTKIPAATVSSQQCSQKTVRRRSQFINQLRRSLAKDEGVDIQQQDELLQSGLQHIIGTGIRIPTADILELKSFFNLSWRTLRRLKRWLKARNVCTGGEEGVRALEDKVIGGNLHGDILPLQGTCDITKSSLIQEAPLIQVSNLQTLVFDLLEQYDDLDELTWHKGRIPNDEVWLKVGGDKGGGTFKMMIQLANLERPNSLSNTRIVLLYPGTDTSYNLDVALKSFSTQVEELTRSTWRGKKMKLFVFGDYEFLTRMYGLTGPSGRHCCLFCNITKQEMATPPMQRAATHPRTLQSLRTSLDRFKECGIPKEANNVVRQPFFEIPIDHVCPPGLHISLGIHLKHFVSLSKACHLLDLKIAQQLAKTKGELEAAHQSFTKQVKRLVLQSKADELQQEVQDLIEQHTMIGLLYPENEPPGVMLDMAADRRKEKIQVEKEISKLPELPAGTGPISQQLEHVLQAMKVCRQAYYGGSFVGNHVHISLQPHNVDAMTDCLEEVINSTCPQDEQLKAEAGVIAGRYNQLFHLFGACHRGMNSGTFLDNAAIAKLDENIRDYMAYFRQHFPTETVTPKQHILEEHTIPWMKQWRASFGMMGEQGGESVHCQVNGIMRDLRGYNDNLKLYLQSVRAQWIKSSPPVYHQRTQELQSKRK